MSRLGNRFVLFLLGAFTALALLVPAAASATGTPDISLEKKAPEQALIGTQQRVTLVAKNPAGEIRGYNLSFRDVLPKGVAYVAGSASIAPRILEDEPVEGETTLLFENVADLSANSEYALSYEVKPSTTYFSIAGKKVTYTNKAEDFVSQKPRKKPTFGPNGEIVSGYKGSAEAQATTELTAVEIEKSEPSPEGEILRGVHEHQTVYTLTVHNNHIGPTSNLEVEDWLPAGLEFLGCGTVDHTTNTKTNPGSAEEYPGSGPIDPGNAPKTEDCAQHLPYYVKTEEAEPPGRPKGVYTHVKWKDLGELAPEGELKIQYVAAVPILRNSVDWLGTEPSAESLGQVANLNNNTGPETFDEEPLINTAQVVGEYEKVKVKADDTMERTAEDLAIQKSVTPGEIEQGEESTWTFNVESSEYRYINGVEIDDTLPNGLCPLGAENYEGPMIGAATEPLAECDPSPGAEPTYEILGSDEGPQPAEYSAVEEQPNGTFKIRWNETSVPAALAQMEPSEHLVLKFPTRTRTHYQKDFESTTPVLTGDSWTNHVETQGDDFARCAPADPLCTLGRSKIFTEEPEGKPVFDVSEASQQAGGVTIDKTVRENDGKLVPEDCEGPKSEYVQGLVSPSEPKLPLYSPGDEICWTLRVDFAAKLFAGHPLVTDFVPSDEEYVEGSAFPVQPTKFPEGENSIPATFSEEFEGEKESLQWELGEAVASGHQVFEWRFRTKVKKEPKSGPEEITGNLMKFVYSNSEGQTFPLRDRAEVERQEPVIELAKGITEVGGTPVAGGFTTAATAHGGEVVTYALKLSNGGNMDAQETEVWDVLPEGVECSDVVAESLEEDGGKCSEGTVVWTGLAVEEGGTTTVTYQVKLPTDFGSAHVFTNEAGVTHYRTPTNTGEEFEYIPAENINPKAGEPNTEPILAKAKVTTALATLKKSATTETTQLGNNATQATIGEIVDYEVKATTPEGSVLYGSPTVTDQLPSNLTFLGITSAEIDGEPLSSIAGLTIEETAPNGWTVHFPAEYVNPGGSGTDTLVVKFKARVKNLAINKRGVTITNSAAFNFKDKEEGAATKLTASAGTPIVEPNLKVSKSQSSSPTEKVGPGDSILYTVTAKDLAGTGVSTANEVELVDTIPAGMEVEPKSVEESGGAVVGKTIVWKVGSIVPGGSVSKTYKLRVEEPATAASIFTNEVVGTTQSLADVGGLTPTETRKAGFVEGAYKSSAAGYEASAAVTLRLVGATVSKEVSRPTGTIGNRLIYTLHMNLPPGINFFDTTMVDTLPNGVAFDGLVSAKCVKGCEGTVEGKELTAEPGPAGSTLHGWFFGNFAAGEARELVVQFKAHIADEKNGGGKVTAKEELTNSVVGLYDEAEKGEPEGGRTPTPGSGNNSFSEETNVGQATTKVVEPNVTLTKGVTAVPALEGGPAEPNSKLTYTLAVGNTGNSTAYEVEVLDTNATANLRNVTPVEGASYVKSAPGKPLRWVIPEIEAGKSVTLTYTAEPLESEELEADEEIKNAAEVPVYFGLPEPERSEAPVFREYEGPTAEKDLGVALPEIKVVKTTGAEGFPDSATAEVGKGFKWRVVVKNESAVAGAKAAGVTDVLPAGWEYVAGSTEFKAVGAAAVKPAIDPEQPSGEPGTLVWGEVASSLPPTAAVEVLFETKPTTAAAPGANVNSATGHFEDLTGATGSAEGPYEATDTAEAVLVAPELAIEKTPDGGETVAGTTDHYDIKVTNNGTGPADEVLVEDVLRPGQEFVGPAHASPVTGFAEKAVEEGKPAIGETTIFWTIAQIPAGKSVTIEVPIATPPSLAEGAEITDIATVSSPQQAKEPSDEGSFVVHRETDLKIEKEADRPNINAGENIDYKLTAKNLGPSDATGVVVTDKLPADTAFVKAEPSASCTFDAGTDVITCEAGELADGAKAEFHVEVEVISAQTEAVFNTAEVTGEEKDPEPANNKKTVETPIGGSADLKIVKTGPSEPVLLGNEFTYTLEVSNAGPSDAAAVKVIDELPSEVEFVEAIAPLGTSCAHAGGTPSGGTLTCELGTFVRNATPVVIEVTVKATALSPAEGVTENTAEVSSPTDDPDHGNDESTAKTEIVPAADLALTKTAPAKVEPNGDLTYNLKVENLGPSDAHGVTVTDPLPAGVEFVSTDEGCFLFDQTTVICEAPAGGFLEVGETAKFTVTVHVPFALGGKTISNTASVEAEEGDPNPENNIDTATTTVGPAADLSIVKTMGAAQAGKPLTYTLAIANHGPSTSSAVTVKDTLPAGTTFQSAAPSQGTCAANGQAVTCQLGALASGASAQVSITVEVAKTAAGTLRNVATVEGPEPDPDPANNESAVEGPIAPAPPSSPNLKVVKTASTSTPQVGAPFTYDVAVTNLSGATAMNVTVLDTLNGPAEVGAVKPESGHCKVSGSKIECHIPQIAVGKTVHIRYSVTATTPGKLSNTASAEAANGETAPANNHAVKNVRAQSPPGNFALTKTASRKVVSGGGKVGFTITLRNGAQALTDAKICDRLPAALVFVKAAGARFVDGEACWAKAYVAPHKALRLHLLARAVNGYKSVRARNVATAEAANASKRSASATVRIEPSFAGAPGGVTG